MNVGEVRVAGQEPVEVVVNGAIDVWTAPALNHTLEEAIAQAPGQLIIDLSRCQSIDAAGILLLLDVHRRAIRNGGSVALRAPSERLRRNLRLAHADKVLQVINTCAYDREAQ
jgi:anti-sigma B factor antagonist